MARGRHSSKKKRQFEEPEGEIVDDLAHAAIFAIQPTFQSPAAPLEPTNSELVKNAEDDDIEIDDDEEHDEDEEDEDSSSVDDGEKGDVESDNNDDDDDDNESDTDLAAVVAELEQPAQDEELEAGAAAAPKTENELDAYRTPIQELERHLKFQLTVEDIDGETTFRNLSSDHLSLAGQVKHFMAVDRTVVVESAPSADSNKNHGFEDVIPLDEGSLLLIRAPGAENGGGPSLIPLGRVFEVFGPVARPLYTIRLPASPPQKTQPKPPTKTTTSPNKLLEQVMDLSKSEGGDMAAEDVKVEPPNRAQDEKDPSVNNHTTENQETKPEEPDQAKGSDAKESQAVSPATDEIADNEEKEMASEATTDGASSSTIDPWASTGEYGKILLGGSPVSVYYVRDEAKLVDTGAIMRSSGKGCDASNLYDEEVTNTNDMYFSDDEKERQAKNRRKSGRSQPQQNRSNATTRGNGMPQGFHQPSPQGFYRQPPPGTQQQRLPTGFHPQAPPPTQQFHNNPHQSYHYSRPMPQHGSGMPPPPPPPPPPPRPRNSNQPDTPFYYQY